MRIALIGRAYTGKTSIAQELVGRGFTLLSFTTYLKEIAAEALNTVDPDTTLTAATIQGDKPRYRRFLQELGSLIGFDTKRKWLEAFLYDATRDDETSYVVDNLRSTVQVKVAREFGFKIVGVTAPTFDRRRFAGVREGELDLIKLADEHPIDGNLRVDHMGVDYIVANASGVSLRALVDGMLGALHGQE